MTMLRRIASITAGCLAAMLFISSASAISVNRRPDLMGIASSVFENPAQLEEILPDSFGDVRCWKDRDVSGDSYQIPHPFTVLILKDSNQFLYIWFNNLSGWYGFPTSYLEEGPLVHAVICADPAYAPVQSSGPRWTGNYVYTLLGNYPCNLITDQPTIPSRFLNQEYTGPLCKLPDRNHQWNGEWIKNREMDYGGYLKGGRHYDTRW